MYNAYRNDSASQFKCRGFMLSNVKWKDEFESGRMCEESRVTLPQYLQRQSVGNNKNSSQNPRQEK
jgi:hypothetical protein